MHRSPTRVSPIRNAAAICQSLPVSTVMSLSKKIGNLRGIIGILSPILAADGI